jgi:alpha-D-xyloside xylohydrolase
MLYAEGKKLIFRFDDQLLWIEPWGKDALRVRATKQAQMPLDNWALSEEVMPQQVSIETQEGKDASIINGKLKATVSKRGKIIMYNAEGKIILEEYARHRRDLTGKE